MRNILCDCCSEPAVEYEYSPDHLDGKVLPCMSCAVIGHVYVDYEQETGATVDFQALSSKELSLVDFGIIVDGYELSQKKLDEAIDQNAKLQAQVWALEALVKKLSAL